MDIRMDEGLAIAKMPERFDAHAAKEVEEDLVKALGGDSGRLVCDFSGTEFISSAGLRVLLAVRKRVMKPNSGEGLGLCGLPPYIREIFELSGLVPLFDIFETVDEAKEKL